MKDDAYLVQILGRIAAALEAIAAQLRNIDAKLGTIASRTH
jgi:hypothetical protein